MIKKIKILIVEDDLFIARILTNKLESEGCFVRHSSDIGSMFLHIHRFKFDAIILDISLPSGNILDNIDRLQKMVQCNLFIFTAKEDVKTELRGVRLGVTDFVLKKRGVDVLIERLKRSLGCEVKATPVIPNLNVSYDKKEILFHGQSILLTPNELKIFLMLYYDFDVSITRDELVNGCYGCEFDGYSRGVDLIISRLRKKLNHQLGGIIQIKSVRGSGYKLIETPK